VAAAGLALPAGAVVGAKGDEPPVVTTGRAPRAHREVAWQRDAALEPLGFRGWTAIYDADTDVPVRLWGPGQLASGSMASPAIAEAWARQFLAAHLDMLAPGATASDFVLVANELNPSGDLRSVGFAQYAGGIAVLGGSISFAFKNDRMIMAGSTALPHVTVTALAMRSQRLAAARVTSSAVAWLASAGRQVAVRSGVAAERVIVPIIHTRGQGAVDVTYTLAEQLSVETTAGAPGRWNVYVDAASGAAFARESTLSFATGTVSYDVAIRAPTATAGRHAVPAAGAVMMVNGAPVTSGADGSVTLTGANPATLIPGLTGPRVAITNKGSTLVTDNNLTLAVNGTLTWNTHVTEEKNDAQIAAFIYASQAKAFAKANINPTLAYLDQQLSVTVNEVISNQQCNAFSTGDDVHFFPQSPLICENTGRMADVVYHEFGHSLHRHSIIAGVGEFNPSMSEGVADTLAVSVLHGLGIDDSGMGRGFFLPGFQGHTVNEALRELNPVKKKVWPKDADGEVHDEGEIYGEAMWDLRTNLMTSMGAGPGFTQFLKIYYSTVQRAVDIPSSFAEALLADDDDGNLANGTPHECDIIHAFSAHGLYDPLLSGDLMLPVRDNFKVSITAPAASGAACSPPAPAVASAKLSFRPRGGTATDMVMAATGTTFSATIPTQPDGIVEYSVTLTMSNGQVKAFPDNPADPYYQFSIGEVTKLWCTDFENGASDWTHVGLPVGTDVWEAGVPKGAGGGPRAAFAGTKILGTALSMTGQYSPLTNMTSITSPVIDLQGNRNVHLQYYRWLGVEDGFFDQATILANDVGVWRNLPSRANPGTKEVNHIDREWRFQDVPLTAGITGNSLAVKFSLSSDEAVEASGWNLDNLCVVALPPACGNSIVDPGETCDDGNTTNGDGCSSTCAEEKPAGGCCGVGTHPVGPAGLAALVLGLVLRRRRRR